jgi:hypothetical protein
MKTKIKKIMTIVAIIFTVSFFGLSITSNGVEKINSKNNIINVVKNDIPKNDIKKTHEFKMAKKRVNNEEKKIAYTSLEEHMNYLENLLKYDANKMEFESRRYNHINKRKEIINSFISLEKLADNIIDSIKYVAPDVSDDIDTLSIIK